MLFWITTVQAAEPVFSSNSTNHPASRVVIVENQKATQHFVPQHPAIPQMIDQGVTRLMGSKNAAAAWKSIFKTNDVIGIKVYCEPGPNSGTRVDVVDALVRSLLNAKIPAEHIIIWDKQIANLYRAGFRSVAERYGVRLAGAAQAGYDESTFYENAILGTPVWGDLEFEKKGEDVGRKSYVSKLLTREITKIISVAPLLNHNRVGVTGNLLNVALGAVDNTVRFETSRERLATAVPELYAMEQLSDRVVLCITDALICQYEGEHETLLHYSTPLNQLWFSKDPVALDTLAINEIRHQRERSGAPSNEAVSDLYKNAHLMELGTNDPKKITVERIH